MSNNKLWGKPTTKGQPNDEQHIELINKMFKAYVELHKNDGFLTYF